MTPTKPERPGAAAEFKPKATRRNPSPKKRFARDERGSAAIEYVLWWSLLGGFTMIVADVTLLFMANAQMWHAAQDSARRISLAYDEPWEAEMRATYAIYPLFRENIQVTATTGETITVEISLPVASATVFGVVPGLDSGALTARAVMRDEVAALTQINANGSQVASSGELTGG